MYRDRTWLIGVLCAITLVFAGVPAYAQPVSKMKPALKPVSRVALVIGNGSYENAPLRNPVNDARAVASSLARLGFRVILRTDLDLPRMLDAMDRFVRDTRNDEVRLFFYAGHGVQLRGKNFLVPIDARMESEEDIPTSAADLQQLIEHLQRGNNGFNIVILDACRTYPMPVRFRQGTRGISATARSPGLAQVAAPGGTVIAFSTSPGSVARDGGDQHSVYAKHLLSNLEIPGLTIEQLFKRVRAAVLTETEQSQLPWESSSLVGDFCFRIGPRGDCPGADGAVAQTGRAQN